MEEPRRTEMSQKSVTTEKSHGEKLGQKLSTRAILKLKLTYGEVVWWKII